MTVYDFPSRTSAEYVCPLLQVSLTSLEWSVLLVDLHGSDSETVREIAALLDAKLKHPTSRVTT